MMQRILVMLLVLALWPAVLRAQPVVNEGDAVWRITTLRAAPGQWRALKSLLESQGEAGSLQAGRRIPYRIRHSQGDQWDFMLLQPVGDLSTYFADGPVRTAEKQFRDRLDALTDHASDWFTHGPAASDIHHRFEASGLFHVEMFRARAGQHAALLDQRQRENVYYQETGRPGNVIWHGGVGADWDNMTIGFHESMQTFAVGSGLTPEAEEEAARKAGFDSASDLAPVLRATLMDHHDTLATRMD